MVILDYSDADSGFWASTPQGLVEVIKFQNHFYALRQVYKRAQDAISACRADIERGLKGDFLALWCSLRITRKCGLNCRRAYPCSPNQRLLLRATLPSPS
jgi:hypothetical protein